MCDISDMRTKIDEIHAMCTKILSILNEEVSEEAIFRDAEGNIICTEEDVPKEVLNTEKYHEILNSKTQDGIKELLQKNCRTTELH